MVEQSCPKSKVK